MIKYDEPIYDPFGERGPTFYHPANETAIKLIAIQMIYRDILKLLSLYKEAKDDYTKHLLAKYMTIELLSVDQHIINLTDVIISHQADRKIIPKDLSTIKSLSKQYRDTRKKNWDKLKVIRDKLAAHRDPLDLITISKIWDTIDIKIIIEITNLIPPLFNFLKDLNIYCWIKTGQDEQGNKVIALVQPLNIK